MHSLCCNPHLVVAPVFLLTLAAASPSVDETSREASIQQIAEALQKADPCANAPSPAVCHYERALGLVEKILPSANQQGAGEARNLELALCSLAKGNEYCQVREQALQRAVEILEGRPLWSKKLFDIVGDLEELLDMMRPGSVASFRRTHLVSAINAQESNPSDGERAQEALLALESVKWPNGSAIDQVIDALHEVVRSSSTSRFFFTPWYNSAKSRLSSLLQKAKDRLRR